MHLNSALRLLGERTELQREGAPSSTGVKAEDLKTETTKGNHGTVQQGATA